MRIQVYARKFFSRRSHSQSIISVNLNKLFQISLQKMSYPLSHIFFRKDHISHTQLLQNDPVLVRYCFSPNIFYSGSQQI
ncbi:Uncharacterised protein [Mycobacteroides abscessus subsp. abscessus]|nr:Uncharacterised protein [Mycobacteroides abscessus subsp. abscessus]